MSLGQSVASDAHIAFSTNGDYVDVVGNDITLNSTGTEFTIHRAGLYHVEWSVNLGSSNPPVIIGLMENDEATSVLSNSVATGNLSSGALISVSANETPYTFSLHNYGGSIELDDLSIAGNIAGSIRIVRFADGPA